MNRKIIASLLNNANHLDTLGYFNEANTLTKLAQYYQREVGPPTRITVGPRGSFDQSSMLNEIAPTDRRGYQVIVVLEYGANETEKRLSDFNNITHANNTAKKIARTTKEKYDFEPQLTLWNADPGYVKAHEMFMAGELDRLDLGTVRQIRNEMAPRNPQSFDRPEPSRPSGPPKPRQGGVYTLTHNYDPDKGYYVIMNEDGRIRELKPSGGKFKDMNHAINYCKAIKRDRPEFKIIDGVAQNVIRALRKKDEEAGVDDWKLG